MKTRTVPRHKTREWTFEGFTYTVDYGFTDEILACANRLVAALGGEVRSICLGHAPSELAKNGGQSIGGGTELGHLRFAVPQHWPWLAIAANLSFLPNTHVAHTTNYARGLSNSFFEIQCLIFATTKNLPKRLQWWSALLAELTCYAQQ